MTFKFEGFHGRALYELNGLPEEVRDGALVDYVLRLLEAPWDAAPVHPGGPAVAARSSATDRRV
ncbi:MAG TPA: hypothetical protein VH912_09830 [Streptosporangiaceae bacterium]